MGNIVQTLVIVDQDRVSNMESLNMGIPWYDNSEDKGTESMVAVLNIREYEIENLEEMLEYIGNLKVEEITKIFISCNLKEDLYEFIAEFCNLKSLYIYKAKVLKDIGFLKELYSLTDLWICDSQISNLSPIRELIINQWRKYDSMEEEEWLKRYGSMLDRIGIMLAQVKSLSVFENIETQLCELTLVGNQISDLKPLASIHVQYLNIANNPVKNIEEFMYQHKNMRLSHVYTTIGDFCHDIRFKDN